PLLIWNISVKNLSCGFTLPSAIVVILFALGFSQLQHFMSAGVVLGLKVVASAVLTFFALIFIPSCG
ncbi:MAG: hypothetical protein PHD18_07445, partial [Tolumonas sp.]|nr:hypothetical protein [Tolumonas sp.]